MFARKQKRTISLYNLPRTNDPTATAQLQGNKKKASDIAALMVLLWSRCCPDGAAGEQLQLQLQLLLQVQWWTESAMLLMSRCCR